MRDVAEFHSATGSHVAPYPQVPEDDLKKLRVNLVMEETREAVASIEKGSLPQIAKELCDLMYVVMGTALSCGLNLEPVWDEVHKNNMSKVGGEKRKDGKILKPANYKEVNVKPLIDDQIMTGILRAKNAASE